MVPASKTRAWGGHEDTGVSPHPSAIMPRAGLSRSAVVEAAALADEGGPEDLKRELALVRPSWDCGSWA